MRTHCGGHIVACDVFLGEQTGNICCGHKMFLKEIRNIFVSRTQIFCPQQMLRAGADRETFVSATMCPQCVLVCHSLNDLFPEEFLFDFLREQTADNRLFLPKWHAPVLSRALHAQCGSSCG